MSVRNASKEVAARTASVNLPSADVFYSNAFEDVLLQMCICGMQLKTYLYGIRYMFNECNMSARNSSKHVSVRNEYASIAFTDAFERDKVMYLKM